MNHPLFHTLFDIKRLPQIPSIDIGPTAATTSERGPTARCQRPRGRGRQGRVLVFISHNSDFGDAYEREADDPQYFYNFSVEGYAIGINILLYAMTH